MRLAVPIVLLVTASTLLPTATGWAQSPAPLGSDFQVNSYTTGMQRESMIAAEPAGGFTVAWNSYGSAGTDTSEGSIQARRFAADGTPLAADFQVNTYTTSYQSSPALAYRADGSFVVVWDSFGSPGPDDDLTSVQAQRFASSGVPADGQFQVNTYTYYGQGAPTVAVRPNGDFLVVWAGTGSKDISGSGITGRPFTAGGMPAGDEFLVNSSTSSLQTRPVTVAMAGGDFVAVWDSYDSAGSDNSSYSIQAQRLASDGMPLGGEIQVNTYTTFSQSSPSVAVGPGDNFVVVWQSQGSSGTDNDDFSIQGQRFASDGTPLAGEFQVNSYTTSDQEEPAVAYAPSGDFLVVWQSQGSSGTDVSGLSIQGQLYAPDGTKLGDEFQVNTYTTSSQSEPQVAAIAEGIFTVTWTSFGSADSDTSADSIQARRFLDSGVVFIDGFESGDTGDWDITVP